MKVIVLGVGSMGAAACHYLVQRGVEVLGIDQFEPPHGQGSHHGGPRMIRQAYFEHPDYVPLLLRAYELWYALEEQSGESLLDETGGLYMGPRDSEIVSGSLQSAREHGLLHALLEHEELARRFPQFNLPDNFMGLYEEKAGYLHPELSIQAMMSLAKERGADFVTGERVVSWSALGEGVEVRTEKRVYQADRLVIAAGAWAGQCLSSLDVNFQISRQVLGWFKPRRHAEKFQRGEFPCWFVETHPPCGHYGFPVMGDSGWIKFALHCAAETYDPDDFDRPPADIQERAALQDFVDTYLPMGEFEFADSKSCLYTNTPDQHFVMGLHPEHQQVSFAAGFSGHGFKFATVIGEILGDLAVDQSTDHPIEFLSPERFA